MSRVLRVGGAQLGPVQKAESRQAVVRRMLDLLAQAKDSKCDLVVYPELALTTFFPRWYMTDLTWSECRAFASVCDRENRWRSQTCRKPCFRPASNKSRQ